MERRELTAGDVVRLRSGGPAMVLFKLGIRDDGTEVGWCAWVTEAGDGREYPFPLLALVIH